MKITVRVRPQAKEEKVVKVSDCEFKLSVKAPATEGRANKAVIELLSEYFDVPKTWITIIRGEGSRNKIIQIEGP